MTKISQEPMGGWLKSHKIGDLMSNFRRRLQPLYNNEITEEQIELETVAGCR